MAMELDTSNGHFLCSVLSFAFGGLMSCLHLDTSLDARLFYFSTPIICTQIFCLSKQRK